MVTWSSPTLHKTCCNKMMLQAGMQQTRCFHTSKPTIQPSHITKISTLSSSAQLSLTILNTMVGRGNRITITLTKPTLTKELNPTMLSHQMSITSRKEFKTSRTGFLARMVPPTWAHTSTTTSKTGCIPDKHSSHSRMPFVFWFTTSETLPNPSTMSLATIFHTLKVMPVLTPSRCHPITQ